MAIISGAIPTGVSQYTDALAVAAVEAESGVTLAGPIYKTILFSRDMSLASGSQVVTGFGFKPRYVAFEAMLTSDWIGQQSQGWDAGVARNCFFSQHNHLANSWSHTDVWSILMEQSATGSYRGKVTTIDADGFTFAWTKGGTPTGMIIIMARGHK